MGAGDDEGVEGAGGAVIFGPDFLQLIILANEDGLHHAGAVRVAVVEAAVRRATAWRTSMTAFWKREPHGRAERGGWRRQPEAVQ